MHNKDIYHLLRRALCQSVSVSQVVDLDVFDVVAILLVDLCFELVRALAGGWRGDFSNGALGRSDGRYIDMLYALSGLQVCIDLGCCGR